MFCAKCGKEMEDNTKFCPSCGAEASGETTSEQPAAEQPATEQPAAEQPAAATAQPATGSAPVETGQTSGVAVGALVCGILGLVLCWVPVVGLILAIVATVLGGKGRKTLPEGKKGMALAGFIIGIIGLIIGIIYLIWWIVVAVIFGAAFGALSMMM
jgi:thiol:disulfide interchange protein